MTGAFQRGLLTAPNIRYTATVIIFTGVGLSFSTVLFYGQEMTLITFELLIFAVIDLASSNYVLDAIISFLLMEVSIFDNLS